MKFSLFIGCILLLLNEGKCKLDFSQFHLPPCCFTPETFSGYATRSGAPSKRETPQEKVDNAVSKHDNLRSIEVLQNGSVKVNNENVNTHELANPKIKFYSLIIPIEDLVNSSRISLKTKQSWNMDQHKPLPISGRVLFPKGKLEATDNSREHSESTASKILEKIFNTELDFDDKTKRIIRRKSAENLDREHRADGVKHKFSGKKLINQYINWESKRITQPMVFTEKDDTTISQPILQDSATEHQSQVVKQIPSSWVKYLKRALYQSVTDGKGLIVDEGAGTGTFHSRNNAQNQIVKSKIRFPDTWKSIKSSKLQYVDSMAQVSTTPYGAIYLPPTEGPVVSGILVNSPDGFFHLRVASELYFAGEQIYEQNCGCYLLRPGEILVAYWSVSRIFKENGLPALQYLVYPLPHSVPTPPELLPFSNSAMFHPSEIDPLNNFFENIQHSPNYIDYESNRPPPPPQEHHPLNYASKGHGHTMTRNPKPIQPFPNDELFLEHFNQQIQIGHGISPSPQPYPIPQGPSPTPSGIGLVEQSVPQPQQQLGVNVFLDNEQHIPQHELLAQYQQLALQNAFNGQFANGQNGAFHSIRYNDLLNGQGPYEQPTQLPPPQQPSLVPTPQGQHQQEGLSINFQLPVRVNPTDPSPPMLTEQSDQISKPPTTFPNSIQDIISPQDLQPQQQPILSQQMDPPSTLQGISAVVEQPSPTPNRVQMPYPFILGQLPFLVNYPPHFPPAYMDFNPLQYGIQKGGLQNPPQQHHNVKQAQGYEDQKLNSEDNAKKTEDRKVEQPNKNEDQVNHNQRPLVITNIMDNEKKYYPVRQSQRNSPRKEYEKYRYERQRRFRKQKLVNDINKKGGYILDF